MYGLAVNKRIPLISAQNRTEMREEINRNGFKGRLIDRPLDHRTGNSPQNAQRIGICTGQGFKPPSWICRIKKFAHAAQS